MRAEVQWIINALNRNPEKTRSGIARALNVDKSAVTRLLAGERLLKFHEAQKIAEYLEIQLPLGLSLRSATYDAGTASAIEADRDPNIEATAPIYDVRKDYEGDYAMARHEEPIDWKLRAPHFLKAAKVFGIYVPDNAMAPRFKPGEIAWVDPGRPVRPGDDVLLVKKRSGKGLEKITLGELVKATSRKATIIQHRDQLEDARPLNAWTILHVMARY